MTESELWQQAHRAPSLSLDDRTALFSFLEGIAPPVSPLDRVYLGEHAGWLIRDSVLATHLLRSDSLIKGRAQSSLQHLGGFSALTGEDRQMARRQVVGALNTAVKSNYSSDSDSGRMQEHVRSHDYGQLILDAGLYVLGDLMGAPSDNFDRSEVARAMTFLRCCAENQEPTPLDRQAHTNVVSGLVRAMNKTQPLNATFAGALRTFGWSPLEVAHQILGLLLAGWETLPASIVSTDAVLKHKPREVADVRQVLRSYPPTWLVVRRASAPVPGLPITTGDLVVVSPWLLARRGDLAATSSDRDSANDTLLFGAGHYRCPAFSYAPNIAFRLITSETWNWDGGEGQLKVGLLSDRASVIYR